MERLTIIFVHTCMNPHAHTHTYTPFSAEVHWTSIFNSTLPTGKPIFLHTISTSLPAARQLPRLGTGLKLVILARSVSNRETGSSVLFTVQLESSLPKGVTKVSFTAVEPPALVKDTE